MDVRESGSALGDEPVTGLSQREAEARRRGGEGNVAVSASSRGYARILRTNVFSFFQHHPVRHRGRPARAGQLQRRPHQRRSRLVNAAISAVQDIRAKRKLDRLQLLDRSRVTVNRDGRDVEVVPEAVVRGDAVHVRPGDQLVVDGPLLDGGRVDVDESLLTGESEPLHKLPGDDLLSGRFCVGGEGHQLARDVGAASYASRLTADARQVPTDKTPLQNPIEFVLRLMSATILFCLRPPTAPRPPGRCRWDRAALDPSAVDVAETRSPTRRAASTSS